MYALWSVRSLGPAALALLRPAIFPPVPRLGFIGGQRWLLTTSTKAHCQRGPTGKLEYAPRTVTCCAALTQRQSRLDKNKEPCIPRPACSVRMHHGFCFEPPCLLLCHSYLTWFSLTCIPHWRRSPARSGPNLLTYGVSTAGGPATRISTRSSCTENWVLRFGWARTSLALVTQIWSRLFTPRSRHARRWEPRTPHFLFRTSRKLRRTEQKEISPSFLGLAVFSL